MKALVVFAIFLSCMQLVYLQQSTWNESEPIGIKGSKGSKGDVGEKGIQGESCALGSFESEIQNQFRGQEKYLQTLTEVLQNISNSFQAIDDKMATVQQQSVNISKDFNNRFQAIDDIIATVQQQGVNISEDVNNRFQAIDYKIATVQQQVTNISGDFNNRFQVIESLGLLSLYKIAFVQQQGENITENINNRFKAIDDKIKTILQQPQSVTTSKIIPPTSCLSSKVNGRQILRSGVEVYCVNGWTIFQKNKDNHLKFDKTWSEFKHGFGSFSGNFWLGLDNIHRLTIPNGTCRLRVDVWDSNDRHTFAEYSNFYVANEYTFYKMYVSGYIGSAGDGLTENLSEFAIHNNMPFSTKDNKNDYTSGSCARKWKAGWWYNACFDSNLNRAYGSLYWNGLKKKSSTMGVRCD